MANVSIKKGYAPMACELLERFAKESMPPLCNQILWMMARLTWGWRDAEASGGRRKYWMGSTGELARLIGRDRNDVRRMVKKMVKVKLLRTCPGGIGIQSDYDLWGGEAPSLTPEPASPHPRDSQAHKARLPGSQNEPASPHSTDELKKERKKERERKDGAPPQLDLLPNGKPDTCHNRGLFVDSLRGFDIWIIGRKFHPASAPDFERANFRVQDHAVKLYDDCMAMTTDPMYQANLTQHLTNLGRTQ